MYWTLFWTLGLRANEQPQWKIYNADEDAYQAEEEMYQSLRDYPDAEVWVEACYE